MTVVCRSTCIDPNRRHTVDAEAALAKENFTPEVFSQEEKVSVDLPDVNYDDTLRSFGSLKKDLNWEHGADGSPIIVIGLQNERRRTLRDETRL